ncbi:MAG: XRE family transcriptional regulator [Bacteriovoracaceae bacterium]|nr:XRE family transcriptional regulator [Bacteriovoracaceae bacterium]
MNYLETSHTKLRLGIMPENLSATDRLKFNLCSKFITYLLDHQLSQKQLAAILQVDPSRINEIVKYHIHLYPLDRLISWAERLGIQVELTTWDN